MLHQGYDAQPIWRNNNLNGFYTIVLFSLAAIAVLALVMHLTGKSAQATLSGTAEAEALIRETLPDASIAEISLSESHRYALARLDHSNALVLLGALGSRWVVRPLKPGDIRAVSVNQSTVRIRFNDFADPAAELTFAAQRTAAEWSAQLTDLCGPPGNSEPGPRKI